MAPPSPRRSSRARVPNSQSQQSSMSSGTSGRLERSTRLLNKPSSDKSTPTASLSSEPPEDMDDTLLGRRRRRAQEDDFERASRADHSDMANGSDDLQEDDEDEAVRCICGSEDYPGRPLVDGPDAEFFDAVELTEEVTGFFVQCDICKVWQHGACVGIFSAESSPEEYFCEQCRKDLHKIFFANDGQKYSKYVPLYRTSRASSTAASATKDDGGSSRPSSKHSKGDMNHPSKRRSTMNSRDAAYDDEQLRRAIEASKENIGESEDGSGRPAKRGRSDSEENQTIVKRQRTGSRSPSPAVNSALPESREGSDDEMTTRSATRKSRNARSLRERSEKEERERQRQESALKRRGRAERRRAEDSDISEETPVLVPKQPQPTQQSAEIPTTTTDQAAPAALPGTPPPAQPSTSNPQKRAVKSTQKRGKGRNQYTKDRDGDQDESPARSMSRDIQKPDDTSSATHLKSPVPQEPKQTSKVKSSATNKMTMLDMKRRVTAIMDFISRTQIDLAAEGGQSSSSDSGTSTPGKAAEVLQENGLLQIQQAEGALGEAVLGAIDGKDFKELNCMEMMDVLTRDMVKWQNQYA